MAFANYQTTDLINIDNQTTKQFIKAGKKEKRMFAFISELSVILNLTI